MHWLTGSLLNLAKHPASTVQILGAEKALFRAMKTKHDTPKYGLLYHASIIGQSNQKFKGKVGNHSHGYYSCITPVNAFSDRELVEVATAMLHLSVASCEFL